jgi:uncharacterized protein
MSKIDLNLGVISDTHGLLRPQAVAALRGCDLILHVGDVGDEGVLAPSCYVLHYVAELDLDPQMAGFAAVVYGHSHQPLIATRDGVLYLNPGSAGPRRFRLPVTIAQVAVAGTELRPQIVELNV